MVDHGWQDNAVTTAQQHRATVYVEADGSIAGLRNYRVSHSKGDILIFLDADILLPDSWAGSRHKSAFPVVVVSYAPLLH